MAIETVIENGRVFSDGRLQEVAVGIDGGRIVAVGDPGRLPDAADRIDADGLVVLPGIVDTHVHFREPGFTEKEDFETGSKAAARGGITLACDMPNVDPPTNTPERFDEKRELAASKSVIDFGINASGNNPGEIAALADRGAMAIKQFMIADTERSYPHMPGLGIEDLGHLYKIFEETEKTGLPLMVHPHSQAIAELAQERIWAEEGHDWEAYRDWYCWQEFLPIVEAVGSLIELALATDTRTHILHASWERGIELVRRAKTLDDAPITLETNPHALFIRWDDIAELGPYGMGQGVPDHHMDATWDALRDGTIDVIGSDHAPHTREEKEIGWDDMWKSPGGTTQAECFVPLLLDRVNAGEVSLERVVAACCERPARIFGVFPRKGTIQVGADADLALVDMEAEWTISEDDLYTKCGWTPYEGRTSSAEIVRTLVRGETVMVDGEVVGEPGYGEFVRPNQP